jgi:hypothetical protein
MSFDASAAKAHSFCAGHRRRLPSVLVAVALAYVALDGISGCDESDTPPTRLPAADLVAPPADASLEAASAGEGAADAGLVTDGAIAVDSLTQTGASDAADSDSGDP